MIVFTAKYWGDVFTVTRNAQDSYTARQTDNDGQLLNELVCASHCEAIAYLCANIASQAADVDDGQAEEIEVAP